jgi:alpha/beta superfamily hydrolase
VIDTIARRHGFATVRFNFRGVGSSDGRFDQGVGEVDDALAVIEWMRALHPTLPLWIAGYSFGSNVAWRALARAGDIRGALLVAPPVAMMDFSERPPRLPQLTVIAGDEDDYVDAAGLARWVGNTAPQARIETLRGADHFFSAAHRELAAAVERALAD